MLIQSSLLILRMRKVFSDTLEKETGLFHVYCLVRTGSGSGSASSSIGLVSVGSSNDQTAAPDSDRPAVDGRCAGNGGGGVSKTIESTGKLDDEVAEKLGGLIEKAADLFLKEHPEAGVAEH